MTSLNEFKSQKLGKEKLCAIFESIALKSGCSVARQEKQDEDNPFEEYLIEMPDGISLKVHVLIKNISGAGWADKPEIKRIQVRKLPEIPRQSSKEFFMLCGVCEIGSELILAVWDPNNYTTHSTCCSCYVYFSSFTKAITNGFFYGLNKGKEVMTCSDDHLVELLKEISSRYI